MTPEQQAALAAVRQRIAARQGGAAPGVGGSPSAPAAAQPEASQPFQRAGGYGAASAGVNDAVIRAYLGLKQSIPGLGLSEDDQHALRGMKMEQEDEPEKGLRTAGNVGGNMLLTALPATKALKAFQGLNVLKKAGSLAPYLATAGSAGAVEAATSVGEGETQGDQMLSKLKQGATAAVTAPILQKAVGSLGNLVAQPFRAKADAEALFKQGVNPTLQQGAATGWGRFVGGLASGSTAVRNRQEAEVLDALTRRATEGNRSVMHGTGREHLDAAEGYVGDIYSQLTKGKRFDLTPVARANAARAATALNKQGQFAAESAEAGKAVGNILGDSPTNLRLGIDRLRDQYLTPLAKAREAASNDIARARIGDARDVLKHDVLLKALSAQERLRHGQADVLNFDVHRLREAVGKLGEDEGVTLSRLANAYGGKGAQARSIGNTTEQELIGPALRILGRTPTQDEARALKVTVQRMAAPGAILAGATVAPKLALAAAPLYGLSLAGQSVGGAKALLGQTDAQKAIAKFLRAHADSGRKAAVTAATTRDMEEAQDAP